MTFLSCDINKSLIYCLRSSEGSHSGLVRPPAKRLGGEIPLMGSNPIPSASSQINVTESINLCFINNRIVVLL